MKEGIPSYCERTYKIVLRYQLEESEFIKPPNLETYTHSGLSSTEETASLTSSSCNKSLLQRSWIWTQVWRQLVHTRLRLCTGDQAHPSPQCQNWKDEGLTQPQGTLCLLEVSPPPCKVQHCNSQLQYHRQLPSRRHSSLAKEDLGIRTCTSHTSCHFQGQGYSRPPTIQQNLGHIMNNVQLRWSPQGNYDVKDVCIYCKVESKCIHASQKQTSKFCINLD